MPNGLLPETALVYEMFGEGRCDAIQGAGFSINSRSSNDAGSTQVLQQVPQRCGVSTAAMTAGPLMTEKPGGVLFVQSCDFDPVPPKPPIEISDQMDFLVSCRSCVTLLRQPEQARPLPVHYDRTLRTGGPRARPS